MSNQIITGAKGGESKPRPSVEAPDNLQSTAYAHILDLVSEGEIQGLVAGERSVYLDETPLTNADGSHNFSGVSLDVRTGSQDQLHIPGFPAVESEIAVGVELKYSQPWVRAIQNLQLSAVRVRLSTPRLAQTNTSNGDTNGYTVQYKIELSTDGGAYVQVLAAAFSGKTSTKYERSHRIDLPPASSNWQIRVTRLTPNSTSGAIADKTNVDAITEVIDAKLRYPGSAIVGLQFDASQFQSIPTRSFDLRGRIIRVPSNYDPVSRAYGGVWDGSFKTAWTDNPAWIFYDLLLHYRYGLGHLLNAAQVDRWELYRIGQYCDQLVPDGKGGQEPRFTCNLFLQTRSNALDVLQDLATTFRGMSYWAAGSVVAVADIPEDPVYTYANANVIDGKFGYSGSAKKTRYTVALVSWNDPADFYRQKVEYVDDQAGITRYGIQQTEITATGCTSQAQAQRIGKWALLTNRLETESVSFSVGLDGSLARPGQIIRIADNDRAGRRIGGRLNSATLNTLMLDAEAIVAAGDTVTVIMPAGIAVSRTIKSVSGDPGHARQVVLTESLAELPPAYSMWAIDSPALATQLFRVLAVAEDFSDSDLKFTISAVRHNPSKFDAIDNGTRIERPPVTVIPPSVQKPPMNVTVSNDHFVDQGAAVSVMTIQWERPDSAIAFEVYWRKNDGDWIFAGRTGGTSVDVSGIYAGRYVAKVRAINSLDIGSVFATSVETVLNGKTTPPPVVSSLTTESIIFGIRLKWGIPAGYSTADLQRTEIWYGAGNSLEHATKLSDLAYPQSDFLMQGLAAGAQFFFWARLVDRTGNVGPFYPAGGGVMGQASSDADLILDYIKGKIDESSLGQHLKEEIDKISGDGPGSINERLEAINDLIKQYTDALLWDKDKTYAKGEIVRWEQRLYQALGPVPAGTQPPNAQYWKDVGTILEEANALAGEVHNLTQQITNIDGKLTAVSEKVDGVFVQLKPPMAGDSGELVGQDTGYAGVWSVWSAVAEGDYAQAKRTDIVDADIGKANARVTDLTTAMVTADSALGERITQVDAKVGQNTAAIRDETKARVDAVGAVAQRTSTVETNLNGVSLKADEGLRVAQEANGKFSQMWSTRLQYNSGSGEYKFAGIALSIENGPNGVVQSKFVIDADMFAIQQGGTVPFAVEGGQVFMKSAFIQNGSINMLKIGNNLTSSNYEKDVQGWAFLPDGTFQMMATAPGGNKLVINNSGIYIYYPNGVKAIDLSVNAS